MRSNPSSRPLIACSPLVCRDLFSHSDPCSWVSISTSNPIAACPLRMQCAAQGRNIGRGVFLPDELYGGRNGQRTSSLKRVRKSQFHQRERGIGRSRRIAPSKCRGDPGRTLGAANLIRPCSIEIALILSTTPLHRIEVRPVPRAERCSRPAGRMRMR
jgi:hypothetical protein